LTVAPPAAKRLDPAAVALAVTGAAFLIWVGRGSLFTVDDLLWFVASPGLDAEGAIEPHNGHLIATSRVVYHLVFETFGAEYAPIRVLTAIAAGLSALLFYAWSVRRVGRPIALAGMALLLLLGTSYVFLIAGDGLMVQLAVASGIGALLALERGEPRGDALACALLLFGVLTYSVALAFVAAAAVAIVLDRGNARARLLVPLVPALVYGAWWIWAQAQPGGTGEEAELLNLLVVPAFALENLGSALGALTGLDYDFSGGIVRPELDTTPSGFGRVLALAAVLAFVWRVRRPPIPAAVWTGAAYLGALWVLGALTSDAASPPDATRFVMFNSVGILLVATACAAGMTWTTNRWIGIWIVVAFGVALNLSLLLEGGEWRRDTDGPQLRAELTGAELAGAEAVDRPDLSRVAGGGAIVNFPFSISGVERYLAASERYGELGFTAEELRAQPDAIRARADAMSLAVLGVELEPARAHESDGCERVRGDVVLGTPFELPADGAILEAESSARVTMRRFASDEPAEVGALESGLPAILRVPADAAPDPWQAHVGAGAVRVCPL
jgi:hypothetical protein